MPDDSAFPRDEHLTAIAIAYSNPMNGFIADELLPRVTVGKREFSWFKYPESTFYDIPETRLSPRGKVGEVELRGEKETSSCEDFGIQVPLSNDDVANAPKGVDPREKATERATHIVLLDRERQASELLFDQATYPTGNKRDLSASSGAQQFQQTNAKPLDTLIDGLEACLVRPNVVGFGQLAWRFFSMHPQVVKAVHGNSGDAGRATKEAVAQLLEVDKVVVGRSFANSVKPGKAPVMTRLWGAAVCALFLDPTVDTSGGLTFGYTATFGSRVAGSKPIDMGLDGGVAVRSGERRKDLVVAPRAGFLWYNAAVAP
jgi:hypothetical protein